MGVMSAVPAAAADDVRVSVLEPLAGETTTWTITFHNTELLVAGTDYIDLWFPTGSDPTGATWTMGAGTTATGAKAALGSIIGTATVFGTTQVRFDALNATILGCQYVAIELVGVVNPASCFHTMEAGTSNCCLATSNEFAIYTAKMCMLKGMNLISLPSYPADTSIEVVLADLFFWAAFTAGTPIEFVFSVWHWDSWAEEWLIYASDTSFSDLTTMEAGKAYWIKVNYDAPCFYFKGTPYPAGQGPPQKWCYPECWSMIGPASTADIAASDYLSNAMLPWPHQNTYAVSTIFGFNPVTQAWFDTGWDPGQKDDVTWSFPDTASWLLGDAELFITKGYFMSFIGEACIIPPLP